MPPQSREEFEIAIICALPLEADAVETLFDEHYDAHCHEYGKHVGDDNAYTAGRISGHYAVLAFMPGMGNRSSASVARSLRVSFTGIKLTLLVGICGGTPYSTDNEIILGDVIISDSIIEYDFGRQYPDRFVRKSGVKETLGQPSQDIRSFLNSLQSSRRRTQIQRQIACHLKDFRGREERDWTYPGVSRDILFAASYRHKHYKQCPGVECICIDCHSIQDPVCELALRSDCQGLGCAGQSIQRHRLDTDNPETRIHIGPIASASTVMRSGKHRDKLAEDEGIIGFEMEGAGVWDNLPCLIVKGVCDYADSHKNKVWQNYATATAACCTKALLKYWTTGHQQPQLETSNNLKPSSTVPFDRDEMFIGREDIIMAIKVSFEEKAGKSYKRAALVGLGGVGKSQIAIEYTYRVRESAPQSWVFWIHASSTTKFEKGYRNIATVAKIPGHNDSKADTLHLVKTWLSDEKNGSWLMVLDNADDTDTFFNTSDENMLVDYLPHVSHGSILITSRYQVAARNLVGPYGQVIPVESMSTHDAMTLLRTRINVSQPCEELRLLVKALECIPLAITQAGAYISNRSPRMTVSNYIELFQYSETNQQHLLSYDDAYDLRRDQSIRHPVITTWQISFNQIQRICPKATDLLALMSMFDRQGIPEDIVSQGMDELEFEDTIALLVSFSLIRVEIGRRFFEMHRLVQLSIRQWLKKRGQDRRFIQESLQIMKEEFPSGDYKTWESCRMLLPHLKEVMCLTEELDDDENQLNRSSIADRYGWYLYLRGKYKEAEIIHRQALGARVNVLGAEHIDTLASLNQLGLVISRQGKLKEAAIIHQHVLAGRKTILGIEHPDTLTCISFLGSVFSRQGKYKEAESMQRQVLCGREKVLGAEHPDTLIVASILGSVMSKQGMFEEAAIMHRQALAGREKALGAEHPDTLSSINHLGSVLRALGRYEEAVMMHQQALTGRKKVLGVEHPNTLACINNLGLVLEKQGKYEEAESMHQYALLVRENHLGAEHPNTLASVNNLGLVLEKQGKYKEAAMMHKRALRGRENALGSEHPHTLCSVNNLGLVFEKQGRFNEAIDMYQLALAGRQKVLSAKHPNTLTSVNNLSRVLEKQRNLEVATLAPARGKMERSGTDTGVV
ncbi:putative kinesin [Talaromyces proteolyticus]|uniref:Kinesin n=1 Tax=Talaromyces proteolyticus TaxID=1131652 RepID=A0AAD4Q1E0_9EURO|nr:putative kinesin [Talaromyces proteolyticus]KAH8698443.1 putative kinesin [Talaromyces proteolyticus]